MTASRLERRAQRKEQRTEEIRVQRERWARRQRNKRVINYALLAIVLAFIGYGASRLVGPTTGVHDDLARCLSEKGTIMYGTDWCSHCQEQKQRFGKSFRLVNYINCDVNEEACILAGAESYPTWVFGDGTTALGVQTLETLAQRAGCAP